LEATGGFNRGQTFRALAGLVCAGTKAPKMAATAAQKIPAVVRENRVPKEAPAIHAAVPQ